MQRYNSAGLLRQPSDRSLDRFYSSVRSNHLVAIDNKNIVGTACISESRWKEYKDYGEIISGYNNLLLWVLEDNHRARTFYEKNGFSCSDNYVSTDIYGKELREVMYFL